MTLQALDIDLPSGSDSAELAEFKQRVRSVGDKYARRHDWCRVTEEIYKELDIPKGVSDVTVTVSTTHGFSFTVKSSIYMLAGKSAQEQATILLDKIGNQFDVEADGRVVGVIPLTPGDVVSMTLPATVEVPGIIWLYTGRGRVLHAFDPEGDDGYGLLYSRCTRVYNYREGLSQTSSYGTGGRCRGCEKALGLR